MGIFVSKPLRFIDLFCGIGGFHIATNQACAIQNRESACVFASDIDIDAQHTYLNNFGIQPLGDITQIEADDIPDHELLLAGFPCQPFSICGDGKGFDDIRGTLFFDIARILAAKQPKAFVLENVKQLRGHDGGNTLRQILKTLHNLGYSTDYKILNALDFGLPQKRERIFIVGFKGKVESFSWPQGRHIMTPLDDILEKDVPSFYYTSDKIRQNRLDKRQGKPSLNQTTIWHENKGGNISALPYSCALRAGASYNYLLVNGERRLTEREMLRLQGFPESYKIVGSYQATRKQTGNSVAIPCVTAVINAVLESIATISVAPQVNSFAQYSLVFETSANYTDNHANFIRS